MCLILYNVAKTEYKSGVSDFINREIDKGNLFCWMFIKSCGGI